MAASSAPPPTALLLCRCCRVTVIVLALSILLSKCCRPAAAQVVPDSSATQKVAAVSPAVKPIPAVFVFGDSLADSGNNNKLRTLAKANHPPYGQDFPPTHTPTGRFANGFTAIDLLSFKLDLPLLPIHSDPATKGVRTLQGVNFASAASGITSYAGLNFGKVFSLDAQIQQFAEVKQDIIATIGENATGRLLSKSLFYIATGSNDWLNTYFFLGSPLPKLYTRLEYRDMLISKLLSQIKELYNLGARRVAVVGLGAFGCCPSQLRAYKSQNGTCVGWLNDLATDFNYQLREQIFHLHNTLPGVRFVFQDPSVAILEIRNNPSAYGYTVIDHACCGVGKYGGFLNCFQGFPVCDDVEVHLFWDAYHPTSKFQQQFVDFLWNTGPPYSYPSSGKEILASLANE